jgi:hypothetical protein
MKTFFFIVCCMFTANVGNCANDWVPYCQRPSPPQVYVPLTPSVSYYTTETYILQRPAILTYDWVPYYTTKTIVVERQGLICKYRTTIIQPTIEWIYQPVWR